MEKEEFRELLNNKEYDKLSDYACKRAIFIAAGFGSRMVPVTLDRPKPLVKVNGVRIIDTLIDACLKNDIKEVYIVRGYLKDKFNELLDKYPMIKFIDNDEYDKANNILSILKAKDLLSNAYVLEGDLVLSNPNIISKYHYSRDFLGIYKDHSDDWCIDVDKDGIIIRESMGGNNTYQMVGISYWDKNDGLKLAKDIVEVYNDGHSDAYFEQVPLLYKKDNYKVSIKTCLEEDIVEIDSFKELQAIDSSYLNYGK